MCVVLVGPVELAEAGEVVQALARAGAVARAGDDAWLALRLLRRPRIVLMHSPL